jgi:hypothetical protein
MGIEHERIHLETSSVLIRQHALRYVKPHPAWAPCPDGERGAGQRAGRRPRRRRAPGARASTIRSTAGTTSTARHSATVAAFQASATSSPTANFWLSSRPAATPTTRCGRKRARAGSVRTRRASNLLGQGRRRLAPAPDAGRSADAWDWPVETNYHEAKAFCRGRRAQRPAGAPADRGRVATAVRPRRASPTCRTTRSRQAPTCNSTTGRRPAR